MAELKIKADSGGGTVGLKGPATTTGDAAIQLTLPVDDGTSSQYLQTNGSGVLSWATVAAGGKIVQVKYATKVNTFSTAATSFTDVTGLAATITPTSTDNYIAIWAFINGNTTGSKSYGRIARDSTAIGVGTASGSTVSAGWDMNHGGSSNRAQTSGNVWVEQAQSTSSTVYKVQVRHENGGADVYVNRTSSGTDDASCGRYSSSIIVMEFST